ncbi:hypothetical protein RM572_21910 [Streptomyces sp. DSM 42041]|uniref:Uncharacterized protein n=1 Tax=Streptomyces hazeniae TaxID=3075538 RepID=A0ABU2NWQ6_9ACTN|nr:hypothetical protein [Streptomyces sp. DSM 42041]MDT0381418.1 hypothetical protein [Streptomyces sp. DSM 42041]
MGHRPYPNAGRAVRHIHRRPLTGEPPLAGWEPPEVRVAAAAVTGAPVPGLPLPIPAPAEPDPTETQITP